MAFISKHGFRLALVLPVAGLLQSCGSFKDKKSKAHQEFRIEKMWVKDTSLTPNLAFRTPHRFRPLMVKSESKGPLLIQANARDQIVAVNPENGEQVWAHAIENGAEASGFVQGQVLFVGARNGEFLGIDIDTGRPLWSFPVKAETLSEARFYNGRIYFLSSTNTVFCLEAETGRQVWVYSRPEATAMSVRGGSRPAIRQGQLIIGMSDGALVSLNADSGLLNWERVLNRNKKFRDVDADIHVDGDLVYAMGFDDGVYAIRAATGEVAWRTPIGGFGGFLVNGEQLIFSSTTSELIAIDKSTGQVQWRTPLGQGQLSSTPTAYRGMVVVGESTGRLLFFEQRTGKLVSGFTPGRGVFSQVLADAKEGRVYFISNESYLYALSAEWVDSRAFPYLRD